MNHIIKTRKQVYKNFPKDNLEISLSDLVLFYNISENDYLDLISNVKSFLLKSLSLVYNKEFVWTEDFLEIHDKLIMNLPNKTPNGILNPKLETSEEFTKIQTSVNSILNNLGIYPHIKTLAVPNLRYKSSIEPKEVQTRSYYTSKYHSDAWVGHVGDSIFLIGVLGDIDNNTVEFNEPINVHDNYLSKAESFDEGNTRYESFSVLGTLTKGKLGIMDHACLHRTLVKEGSKPRLSLDIAVMVNSEHSHSNSKGFDKKAYKYYEPSLLNLIGKTKKYDVVESITQTTTTLQIVDL
jgi:hypothetical protein